jgi:hypothetical protein
MKKIVVAAACLLSMPAHAHQITDPLGVGHVMTGCSDCGSAKIMFGGTRPSAGRIDIKVGTAFFGYKINMDSLYVGYSANSFILGDTNMTCSYQLQDGPLHTNLDGNQVRDEWPEGSEVFSRRNENDVAANVAYFRVVSAVTQNAFPVGAVLSVNFDCTVRK